MTLSKIEWTDRSDWNPIRGCTRVSPGCGGPGDHGGCYAEAIAARFSGPGQPFHGFARRDYRGRPRWTGAVELVENRLTLPLRWRKPDPGMNRCFPTSTSDPFHENLTDPEIDQLFAVMIMAQHWTFQLLTKRSARMREYLARPRWHQWAQAGRRIDPERWRNLPPIIGGDLTPVPNLWLGVSCEDQQRWDERTADLKATPAAVRWVSAEPLLGPIETGFGSIHHHPDNDRSNPALAQLVRAARRNLDPGAIDWVVAGGESGPRHRDNDFETNARSLRNQCAAAGVAFFGKQNVGKRPLPEDLMVREFPA